MLFQVQFFLFNSTSHINLFKLIIKECGDFEVWWNSDCCFIEYFSRLWETHRFWVERNQFLFNLFQFLMLFYLDLQKLLFCCSKLWPDLPNLAWSLVSKWSSADLFSEVSGTTSFQICSDENFLIPFVVFLVTYQFSFLLLKTLIKLIKIGLEFGLKVIFIIWSFRGDRNHSISNVFWWELVLFLLFFFLELYQFV